MLDYMVTVALENTRQIIRSKLAYHIQEVVLDHTVPVALNHIW